jgi:uncharacterized protein (DUF4415 family)
VNNRSSNKKSRTDWAKVDAVGDDDIDYSDIPEQGEDFFRNAQLRMPEPKALVTIRLDQDVLKWFKKQGSGYQTRINALLRAYMAAQQLAKGRKK